MSDPFWTSANSLGQPPAHAASRQFGGGAGGIAGSLLRPGAIDQTEFKRELAKAQAGTPPPNLKPPSSGIPELSAAQFDALVGASPTADAGSAANRLPLIEAGANIARTDLQSPIDPSNAEAPAAGEDAQGEIILLHRLPDKDEREVLRGKQWRLVEDPKARTLFFGSDGRFGLDDLIDLINPLQHIPLVNVAYRALTGDQIAGAPQLMGSMVFGPFSVMSTIADLAVKSTTGQSMMDNAIAAIRGGPQEPAATQMAANPSETARGSRQS